jgi:hypothetical protein
VFVGRYFLLELDMILLVEEDVHKTEIRLKRRHVWSWGPSAAHSPANPSYGKGNIKTHGTTKGKENVRLILNEGIRAQRG